jgi:hypothetical protein
LTTVPLKASYPLASYTNAKLYKSKAPLHIILCLMIPTQDFTLQVFDFGLSKFIFDS